MNARMGSGWQTVLADLAIILFMITASAVVDGAPDRPAPPPARPESRVPAPLPVIAQPVAVWRAGGLPLGEWLARQRPDPLQKLTVIARNGDASAALALVSASPRPARLVLDPDVTDPPYAVLAYDGDPGLARGLLDAANARRPIPGGAPETYR